MIFSKIQNNISPWIINIFRSSQFCWQGMGLLFRFLTVMNTYNRILATGLVDFGTIADFAEFADLAVGQRWFRFTNGQLPYPPVFSPSIGMSKPGPRTIVVHGKPIWAGGAGAVLPHSQFTKFAKSANRKLSESRTCWGAMWWIEFFVSPTRLYSDSNRHGTLWEQFVCPGLVDFGTRVVSPNSRNSRIRSALKNREESICHSSSFFMFIGWYVPESPEIFSF